MQIGFNRAHGIIPQTIRKPIKEKEVEIRDTKHVPKKEIPNLIIELEAQMREAAERLEFERAIALRNKIRELEKRAAEKK
jgi:excinuclease ABC subunit B